DYANVVSGFGDDCMIERGNSGAPVFNSRGEVVAIVYATGKDGIRDSINEQARRRGIGAMQTDLHVGLFTSFACLTLSIPAAAAPGECQNGDLRSQEFQSLLFKADSAEATGVLAGEGPRAFKYEVKQKRTNERKAMQVTTVTYDVNLICLRPQKD